MRVCSSTFMQYSVRCIPEDAAALLHVPPHAAASMMPRCPAASLRRRAVAVRQGCARRPHYGQLSATRSKYSIGAAKGGDGSGAV